MLYIPRKVDKEATIEDEEKYLTEIQKKQLAIIEHYGFNAQLIKLIEECAELICAICEKKKHINTKYTNNLLEEMADVKNVIEQIELHDSYVKESINLMVEYKTNRELERIHTAKQNGDDVFNCDITY